ncbi:MAG: cytochrome c biogenesis protein CcsA [Bacillota bacterium]
MSWKYTLGFWFFLSIAGAFVYAPPAMGLGDLARIIFFHVPLAWVGVLAYLVAMVNGVRYLKTARPEYDHKAAFNAEIGLVFTLLATVTGAIFARHTWGMYWNWDPRQVSIFVLLLIYGAYFALRSSVENPQRRARLSAVYISLAFITVPFLVFIIPRLYPTLHPDPILNAERRINMEGRMLQVFLAFLAGFTGLYAWIAQLESRVLRLRARFKR